MKLTAIANSAKDLSPQARGEHTAEDYVYAITVGRSYAVAALITGGDGVSCLILNDNGFPDTIPIGLFRRDMQRLPSDWFFIVGRQAATIGLQLGGGITAVCGYERLIEKDGYLGRLFDGEAIENSEFQAEIGRLSGEGAG